MHLYSYRFNLNFIYFSFSTMSYWVFHLGSLSRDTTRTFPPEFFRGLSWFLIGTFPLEFHLLDSLLGPYFRHYLGSLLEPSFRGVRAAEAFLRKATAAAAASTLCGGGVLLVEAAEGKQVWCNVRLKVVSSSWLPGPAPTSSWPPPASSWTWKFQDSCDLKSWTSLIQRIPESLSVTAGKSAK